jgi:hypothetical protein
MRLPQSIRVLPLLLGLAASLTLALTLARAETPFKLDVTSRIVRMTGLTAEFPLDKLGERGCREQLDRLKRVELYQQEGRPMTLGSIASTVWIGDRMREVIQAGGKSMHLHEEISRIQRLLQRVPDAKDLTNYRQASQIFDRMIEFLQDAARNTGAEEAADFRKLAEELTAVRRDYGHAASNLSEVQRMQRLEASIIDRNIEVNRTLNQELYEARSEPDKRAARARAAARIADNEAQAMAVRDEWSVKSLKQVGELGEAGTALSRFRTSLVEVQNSIAAALSGNSAGAIATGAARAAATGEAAAAEGQVAGKSLARGGIKATGMLGLVLLGADLVHGALGYFAESPASSGEKVAAVWNRISGADDTTVFGSSSEAVCKRAMRDVAFGKAVGEKMGVLEMWRASKQAQEHRDRTMADAGIAADPVDKRLPDSVVAGIPDRPPVTGDAAL